MFRKLSLKIFTAVVALTVLSGISITGVKQAQTASIERSTTVQYVASALTKKSDEGPG